MCCVTVHQALLLELQYGASLTQPAFSLTYSQIRERRFAVPVATASPGHPERGKNGWTPEYPRQVHCSRRALKGTCAPQL